VRGLINSKIFNMLRNFSVFFFMYRVKVWNDFCKENYDFFFHNKYKGDILLSWIKFSCNNTNSNVSSVWWKLLQASLVIFYASSLIIFLYLICYL